jgi:putative transposase
MQKFFSKKANYPVFKKKGRSKDTFYVSNDKFKTFGRYVTLPVIGRIKMSEALRFQGRIIGASVSRIADRWFISIRIECDPILKNKIGNANLGIDLGVKASVTCSDGSIYQSPRPLKAKLNRLRHRQRSLSRKCIGSSNRHKAVKEVSRLYLKICNTRNDFLHKTTTEIVRKSQACAVEDLHTRGMLSNRRLSRAIADQGFRQFRTLLQYKAEAYDVDLMVVDRFYPSSKTCSNCGHIKPTLKLSERIFECEVCGFELDRDANAARNIKNQLPSARGKVRPVECLQTLVHVPVGAMKQEFNSALVWKESSSIMI